MVTSSKILTVCYGSFSCTLEGFDDPFTTLQMVAEYFRKLAAEDRFFGSTPQTPDTETLKRIAEENTSKGIDAEMAEDGIILRQTDQEIQSTQSPVDQAEAEAEETKIEFDSIRNDVEDQTDTLSPSDKADLTTAKPATPLTVFRSSRHDADEVADAAAKDDAELDTPVKDDADARAIETAISAAALVATATALRQKDSDPETQVKSVGTHKSVEETLAAIRQNVEQAESTIDAELAEDQSPAPSPETLEIEAKTALDDATDDEPTIDDAPLIEISAVELDEDQGEIDQDTALHADDQADDIVSDALTDDTTEALALEAESTPEVGVQVDELVETANLEEIADVSDENIEADTDSALDTLVLDAEATVEEEEEPETAHTDDEADASDDVADEAPEALILDAEAATIDDAQIDEMVETAQADESIENSQDISGDISDELLETLVLEAGTAVVEDAQPQTAIVEDAAQAPEEQPEIEDVAVEAPTSSLNADQEAELAADLEAAMRLDDDEQDVEEIVLEDATQDESAEETQPEAALEDDQIVEPETVQEIEPEAVQEAEAPSRAEMLQGNTGSNEASGALDRLLAATQSKMDKPEQVRRMNALDQLKAAVAATEADRQVHNKSATSPSADAEINEAADLAAYRDDLRRAQDSARKEGQNNAAPASPQSRPAAKQVQQTPLILVSEQRIDEITPEFTPAPQQEVAETDGNLALKSEYQPNVEPEVATDEIQGLPADAFSGATSFSDFAERIGAFELTDLLEASAAYTSVVETSPRFSRAQVMSKIVKLNIGDAYTKEAGLRSFGKLLRQGKILRVQDGQFSISEASRFSVASRYND